MMTLPHKQQLTAAGQSDNPGQAGPPRPTRLVKSGSSTAMGIDACDDGGFEEVNLLDQAGDQHQPVQGSESVTPVNEEFRDFDKSFPMMGMKRNRSSGYPDQHRRASGIASGFSSSTSGTDVGVMLR